MLQKVLKERNSIITCTSVYGGKISEHREVNLLQFKSYVMLVQMCHILSKAHSMIHFEEFMTS